MSRPPAASSLLGARLGVRLAALVAALPAAALAANPVPDDELVGDRDTTVRVDASSSRASVVADS